MRKNLKLNEVVLLKIFDMYANHISQQEIAEQIGINQSQVSRGLQKLKSELTDRIVENKYFEIAKCLAQFREQYRLAHETFQDKKNPALINCMTDITEKTAKLLGLHKVYGDTKGDAPIDWSQVNLFNITYNNGQSPAPLPGDSGNEGGNGHKKIGSGTEGIPDGLINPPDDGDS